MNTTTLADLRLRCRERADEVNSDFISDAELDRLINVKSSALWAHIATQFSDMLTLPPVQLTVTDDQEWVTLPQDFLYAVAIFGKVGTDRVRITRFNINDLATTRDPFSRLTGEYTTDSLSYRLMGRRLYIQPDNNNLDTIELWYIPTMPKFESDNDMMPADLPEGWDECVVNGVAALIKMKAELDPSPYIALERDWYASLSTFASDRDLGGVQRVTDSMED